MTASTPLPRPTVQLLHELPDGSSHVDWMLAQDVRGRLPLVTFRFDRRLDDLDEGETLLGRRIADHRPAYLTYEGPVPGNRGSVRRLARGTVEAFDKEPRRWRLKIAWEASGTTPATVQMLRFDRGEGRDDEWTVTAGRRGDVEAKLEGRHTSERKDHG